MVSPSDSMPQNQQGKYVRARENPFFNGLTRGNTSMINRASPFDFMGKSSDQRISRSVSVNSQKGFENDVPENVSYKGSHLEIRNEPLGVPISGRVDLGISHIAVDSPKDWEANDDRSEPAVVKSFNVNKIKHTLLGISLPPCAAIFYYGDLPLVDVVESCQSIQKLNLYLKASKDAVNAGVPGKFLRAVLGHVSDSGSFISTIMYSYYLNETDTNSQYCTVPVFNNKRTCLNSHAELKWLLNTCDIDLSSLLFIDEVDLSYYDLFGSLKMVLMITDKLPEKLEALKESVVEIFNCQKGGFANPSDDPVVDKQDCSCCALIAEKLVSTAPEILVGKGVSRLLLAGILLDTENLTSPQCTSVDRYMSTLLLNGAGRFGCNGLYQILRSKMQDVYQLSVGQILRKDFRKWTRTGKAKSRGSRLVVSDVGMSAIGISIPQLLSSDETSIQEIVLFQQSEKLRLLIIVTGYDHHKKIKEMLISAESEDLLKDLLLFLDSHAPHLKRHAMYQPGLSDEMRAFTVENVASKTIMEQQLQDFCRA
nr:exopolyphosphatase PRUNE1-like isoform X1 [Tanacetum cinerariifolium]